MEEINLSYTQYEEELKQIMIEYEVAVGTEGVTAEDALADYENRLRAAADAHRDASEESRAKVESKLVEIAEEYAEIGMAFHKEAAEEVPVSQEESELSEIAEDADPEPQEESSEAPAAETVEDEDIETNEI